MVQISSLRGRSSCRQDLRGAKPGYRTNLQRKCAIIIVVTFCLVNNSVYISLILEGSARNKYITKHYHPLFESDKPPFVFRELFDNDGDDDEGNICMHNQNQSLVEVERDNDQLRCLVPSQYGYAARITNMSRSELLSRITYKERPYKDNIVIMERWTNQGRFANRLILIRNFFNVAAQCNWLVMLPDVLDRDLHNQKAPFNCVDFRATSTLVEGRWYSGQSSRLKRRCENIASTKFPVTSRKRTKAYWHQLDENPGWFPPLDTENTLFRKALAFRSLLAYWGMIKKGWFNCQPCNVNNDENKQFVVYVRGEDVFKSEVSKEYGQPPLDYYIKAIETVAHQNLLHVLKNTTATIATTATEGKTIVTTNVLVVSKDNENPVIQGIISYFSRTYNQTAANNNEQLRVIVNVTTEIGEDFNKVLHQMFCAETLVLGVSSINTIVRLSPTAKQVFYPNHKNLFFATSEDSAGTIKGGERQVVNFTKDSRVSYLYHTNDDDDDDAHNNNSYTPYLKWKNTPTQVEEMMTFRNGRLESGYLDLHTIEAKGGRLGGMASRSDSGLE